MKGNWSVDARLVELAEKNEGAAIVKGETDAGLPVIIIVVTGANVGLLKRLAADILPGLKEIR